MTIKQVSALVGNKAIKQQSSYLTIKSSSSFSSVLRKLGAIAKLSDENSQVNRMWERMTEIALFSRKPHQHRAPAEILKALINPAKKANKKLTEPELTRLRSAFGFLEGAYRRYPALAESKMATDQPQFYTPATTLLSTDLLERYPAEELEKRILASSKMIEGTSAIAPALKKPINEYRLAAQKQTPHPATREKRQQVLVRLIDSVSV